MAIELNDQVGVALPIELMNLAARIARQAGDLVLAGRREGVGLADAKSSATDAVTKWDRASEQQILQQLAQSRPNDSIVGEEGSNIAGTTNITWLVDPIDGTTNFLYDLSGYAISIAACDGDGPLAAAVFLPVTRELFVAARSTGAWLGGRRLRISGCQELALALVGTGFSYHSQLRLEQGQRAGALLPLIRDLRRCGAAAADLCFVAAGRLDAYFETNLQPWDLAAGWLIATEAGASASNFYGEPISPHQVLVATPAIHASLIEFFTQHRQQS